MKFSFVVPVYNTERFLPRCLDSLTAQTDGDFEYLPKWRSANLEIR